MENNEEYNDKAKDELESALPKIRMEEISWKRMLLLYDPLWK